MISACSEEEAWLILRRKARLTCGTVSTQIKEVFKRNALRAYCKRDLQKCSPKKIRVSADFFVMQRMYLWRVSWCCNCRTRIFFRAASCFTSRSWWNVHPGRSSFSSQCSWWSRLPNCRPRSGRIRSHWCWCTYCSQKCRRSSGSNRFPN